MSAPEPPTVLSVEVRRYKNLQDLALPWSRALALYGANGAGKTNILECLAILMGTERTLRLAAPRLATPGPGDLNVVVALPWSRMPIPPAAVQTLIGSLPDSGRFRDRVTADATWWANMGSTEGRSLREGLVAGGAPDVAAAFLTGVDRPLVRYRLERFSVEDGTPIIRRFSRTWIVPRVPAWLRQMGDELPDVFAPLRAAGPSDSLSDVLELPATGEAPAQLEWLARSRSETEITTDLRSAHERAEDLARGLTDAFEELLETGPFEPGAEATDSATANDWLFDVAAAAANSELSTVIPDLKIRPLYTNRDEFEISSGEVAATLGDARSMQPWSSGARRWLDEAFASGARAIERAGIESDWRYHAWQLVPEQHRAALLAQVRESVQAELDSWDNYMSGRAVQELLTAFDEELAHAGREWATAMPEDMKHSFHSLFPAMRALADPDLVIRVVDEPEAHLHPSAQNELRAWAGSSGLGARP